MLKTVLYYTASTEKEDFEEKIRKNLIEVIGNIPLVSVSQKPLPGFGKNICVGEHDCCYANEFRQIQIGLKAIKTPYVIVAEADFLYPPEYFQFKPTERGRFYRYANVWVHHSRGEPRFIFKGFSDGAQAVDRNLWLNILNEALEGKKEWFNVEDDEQIPRIKTNKKHVWSGNPAITFKTTSNVSKSTYIRSGFSHKDSLPYWGSAKDLRKTMSLEKRSRIIRATHLPYLIKAFEASSGDVLEMGTGYFSTLALRWLAEMSGRTLYSYENDMKWYKKAIQNSNYFHKVEFVENWDDADIERPWGMAFIDHKPGERRCIDIERLANLADYIVIHDTEPEVENIYKYNSVFSLFKYRQDFKKYKPWTSIVSNKCKILQGE